MKKYYLISIFFLCAAVPGFAQIIVNADKNYSPSTKTNVVNKTAIAVLNGIPSESDLNSESYHKAVPTVGVSQERTNTPAVVEITVAAQDPAITRLSTVKKEAITIPSDKRQSEVKNKPAIVEISVPAIRQ